jgi:hypothetical protein
MKTRRFKFQRLAIPFSAWLLATLACGSPTKLATVNLHAGDLDQALGGMVVEDAGEGWRFEALRVELLDGLLRVYGVLQAPGGEPVEGSLDVGMSVVEDQLKAEVVGVDMEGVELGDAWLGRFGSSVARLISEIAGQDRQEVMIVSVKITAEALQIGLRFLP